MKEREHRKVRDGALSFGIETRYNVSDNTHSIIIINPVIVMCNCSEKKVEHDCFRQNNEEQCKESN